MIDIRNTPPPFPQGEPRFVEALRRKPEFHTYWDMSLEPQEDEADFRKVTSSRRLSMTMQLGMPR